MPIPTLHVIDNELKIVVPRRKISSSSGWGLSDVTNGHNVDSNIFFKQKEKKNLNTFNFGGAEKTFKSFPPF